MTDEYTKAMIMLAEAGAVFIGQGCVYGGHPMAAHLEGVPMEQRIEFPVAEELQLGACVGLAMQGVLTVSIFPRMDFLLRAADQLVNHLDKIEEMSCGQWKPKVIIRTRVGGTKPLDAGPQHTQNHCEALQRMLDNIWVKRISAASEAMNVYQYALKDRGSVIVVEDA